MNCIPSPYLEWLLAAAFVAGMGVGLALIGFIDWRDRRRAVAP